MHAYDCLTQEQIEFARLPYTPEERASLEFGRSVPRGKERSTLQILADKLILEATPLAIDGGPVHSRLKATLLWLRAPPIGKLAWDFSRRTSRSWQPYRFLHLSRLIRRVRPECVVEFGSGVSTVLIAELLRANNQSFGVNGKVISYEQSPKWYDGLTSYFPEELREYADLRLRPVVLKPVGPYRGIHYEIDEYPKQVDLVYIDGPTHTRGCSECDFAYNYWDVDIIRMQDSGTTMRIAITDKRYWHFPFYKQVLGRQYDVRFSTAWKSIIMTANRQATQPHV